MVINYKFNTIKLYLCLFFDIKIGFVVYAPVEDNTLRWRQIEGKSRWRRNVKCKSQTSLKMGSTAILYERKESHCYKRGFRLKPQKQRRPQTCLSFFLSVCTLYSRNLTRLRKGNWYTDFYEAPLSQWDRPEILIYKYLYPQKLLRGQIYTYECYYKTFTSWNLETFHQQLILVT